jgi:hypothetical protein
VTGFTPALLLKTEKEEGGIVLTEMTDDYVLRVKALKDKVLGAQQFTRRLLS